jgi:hypothetical protein
VLFLYPCCLHFSFAIRAFCTNIAFPIVGERGHGVGIISVFFDSYERGMNYFLNPVQHRFSHNPDDGEGEMIWIADNF